MEEAAEIAKLRLFLALVAAAENVDQLEPLPNIDFNILPGNSLIGLMRVNDAEFEKRKPQGNLFRRTYAEVLSEKDRLIDNYRHTSSYAEDLTSLRDNIQKKKKEALATLDEILMGEFTQLGIKFEEATWNSTTNTEGKPKKRSLKLDDIEKLRPFHWSYEFDQILHQRGGFDAIITNPPWEIFKPNSKEFFEEYSDLVTKKKMTIHEFEKEQEKLLRDPDISKAWLEYLSGYPHLSAYYRSVLQYKNQISIVNGKKAGSDINLYKLFTEQSFNLLRPGGLCGIVIPSGIYTDLGTKQLREMLFFESKVTGLFSFENRKEIFEGVHRSFKFVVLTFQKGNKTVNFPAAFMRHDVVELERFPHHGAINIYVDLVRRLSPDSLSIMEFKNDMDIRIAEKMLRFPMLGERIQDTWNLSLGNEFHMTGDSYLFKTSPGAGRLPLYEGKMIWQFDHQFSDPRYWVYENQGRNELLPARIKRIEKLLKGACCGDSVDESKVKLDYEHYRLGFRDIASSTNERAMICAILPPKVFAGNTLNLQQPISDMVEQSKWTQKCTASGDEILFTESIFNSFTADWMIRQRITSHLNMFYIYQLPIPRLTAKDAAFGPIVERAARLVCTTPEFDNLAKEVGLKSHKSGVTDPTERAKLRAELDGLVAHLYGLTEEEFTHILTTFPLVDSSVKEAAFKAYQDFAPKSADQQVAALIAGGENTKAEFKSSARWDLNENKINKALEQATIKTVTAFLNTDGGVLIIGVGDNCNIVGLEHDYRTLGKKQDRDGYENWLTTLLLDQFGKDCSPLIHITFHDVASKEVCQVSVKASPKPVYVKDGKAENLFIRTGNSTRQLTSREAVEYCKQRWE
jgi:hypothetical protein